MNTSILQRNCKCCGKTLRGRSDKKFCDDFCRNSYNNHVYARHFSVMRSINTILRRNRRLIQEALEREETGEVKTTRESLTHAGFRFNYFTHTRQDPKGETIYYCYDYGYRPLDQQWLWLFRQPET